MKRVLDPITPAVRQVLAVSRHILSFPQHLSAPIISPFHVAEQVGFNLAGDIKSEIRTSVVFTLDRSIEVIYDESSANLIWDEGFIEILFYFSNYWAMIEARDDASPSFLDGIYHGLLSSLIAEKALSVSQHAYAMSYHAESTFTPYVSFKQFTLQEPLDLASDKFRVACMYILSHELGHIYARENESLCTAEISYLLDMFRKLEGSTPAYGSPELREVFGDRDILCSEELTSSELLLPEFAADLYFARSLVGNDEALSLRDLCSVLEEVPPALAMTQSLFDVFQRAENTVEFFETGEFRNTEEYKVRARQYEARMSFIQVAIIHCVTIRYRPDDDDIEAVAGAMAKGSERAFSEWHRHYAILSRYNKVREQTGDGRELMEEAFSYRRVGDSIVRSPWCTTPDEHLKRLMGWEERDLSVLRRAVPLDRQPSHGS